MKTPDKKIEEMLWARFEKAMDERDAVDGLSRLPLVQRKKALRGLVKVSYIMGLQQGYDMGFLAFGEGEEET